MNARDYVNVVAAVVTADNTVWLLITTTAALVAGAASGWISARFRQREARQERIREEVLRWTNPILGAVEGLESRLENILNDGLYLALDPRHAGEKRPAHLDWAASYNYTMPSTLFLFAEYFAWIRLLQERLSFELFESQDTKDRFFAATWSVTKALASWPRAGIVGKG